MRIRPSTTHFLNYALMNDDALLKNRPHLPLVLIFMALFSGVFSTACSGELDPARPEDSYRLFRDALFSGDGQGLWERTDDQTRAYFDAHFERLETMNELIESFLPLTDHQLARQQSGVELLEKVDSGQELFLHIFSPAEFPKDPAVEFGSQVQEIQMAEDGKSALIVTRGGQEFILTLQSDELWYINLAESGPVLDQAFQWLTDNQAALEQTVEDLIAEERQVREQIIAELMGLKK